MSTTAYGVLIIHSKKMIKLPDNVKKILENLSESLGANIWIEPNETPPDTLSAGDDILLVRVVGTQKGTHKHRRKEKNK